MSLREACRLSPAGEAIQFSYTTNGLLTTETDAKGNIHRFTYDALGRLDHPAYKSRFGQDAGPAVEQLHDLYASLDLAGQVLDRDRSCDVKRVEVAIGHPPPQLLQRCCGYQGLIQCR